MAAISYAVRKALREDTALPANAVRLLAVEPAVRYDLIRQARD